MKPQVLQDDQHYKVEVIMWQGRRAIRKSIQPSADDRRRHIFKNEVSGTEIFQEIAQKYAISRVHIPRTFEKGKNWVIREYLKGEPLCETDSHLETVAKNTSLLAEILAAIDRIAPESHHQPPVEDSAPFYDIRKRFPAWSKEPLATNILDEQMFAEANRLIEGYQPHLMPRYAHGDMSPLKHALRSPDEQVIGLFDFEHFSPQKPRYYDAAYCYTRLFTRVKDQRIAGDFLCAFLQAAETTEKQEEQLLAIMTQRAIGMHFDAMNDAKVGVDYIDRAKVLLQICLERDIQRLVDYNI